MFVFDKQSEKMDNTYMFEFLWTIDNISLSPGCCIKSPQFKAHYMKKSTWELELDLHVYYPYFLSYKLRKVTDLPIDCMKVAVKSEVIGISGEVYSVTNTHRKFTGSGVNLTNVIRADKFIEYKLTNKDRLTIRCLMKTCDFKTYSFTRCVARSKINFDHVSFKWILSDFDNANFALSKHLFCHNSEYQFKVIIDTNNDDDNFEITIQKLSNTYEKFRVLVCRITVLNSKEVEGICKQATHRYKDDATWNFPTFLTKTLLRKSQSKDMMHSSLELLCDFFVPEHETESEIDYYVTYDQKSVQPTIDDTVPSAKISVNPDSKSVLIDNFKSMLINNIQTDVVLEIGEEKFPAHKSILSARSPVFNVMFQQGMSETQTNRVKIQDLDSITLKAFLNFLYTGEVSYTDVNVALQLLLAAEKYQIESLKSECCSFLVPALSVKNVCKILLLANMINHEALKTDAIKFIKTHASQVLCSEEWLECVKENNELTTYILCQLSLEMSKSK